MGKCKTEGDQRWESTVNGEPEGDIVIREVNGNGDIEGKHNESHLVGKCRELPHQRPRIRFTVEGSSHLYVGVLVQDRKIEGFRFDLADLCSHLDDSKASPLNGEEDWVAVKGGTFI